MNQTPTTKLVFSAPTTWGRPTTIMLESSVAMKIPTVVTVRTTHLYSKDKPPDCQAFPGLLQASYKTPREKRLRCSHRTIYTDSPRISPKQYLSRPSSFRAVSLLETRAS